MAFEFLAVVILLNVMATVALWREAVRKPLKPKKKFITALLHSDPVAPRHEPPRIIGEDYPSLVTEEHRLFFGDFADFGAVANWWLADEHVESAWRLQELPDTDLKLDLSDTPDFGRRYAVFHNQIRLGTLEVAPDHLRSYSAERPNVRTHIELDYIRLLAFDSVESFLTGIALHVSNPDQNTKEYFETRHHIDRALTQVLWQTQRISEFGMDGADWGRLDLCLDGSASWYLVRRQALRDQQGAELL